MYLVINKCVIAVKISNFSGHYLRNRSTLGIGVLGYIGIVQHKEHSPEVLSIPPGTPCILRRVSAFCQKSSSRICNILEEKMPTYNTVIFYPRDWDMNLTVLSYCESSNQNQTRQVMYVQCDIETRSCIHCCSGKAITITYSECGSVAWVTQHAKRVRCIVLHLWSVSVRLCHTFPHYLINGKTLLNGKCVLIFSTTFVWNISRSKEEISAVSSKSALVFT